MADDRYSLSDDLDSELICADCGSSDPIFIDTCYGVIICDKCNEIHAKLKTDDSHIISVLDMPNFNDILFSKKRLENNDELEKFLPPIGIKTGKKMPDIIRQSFITQKYIKQTFANQAQYDRFQPSPGELRGYLLKKGKKGDKWRFRCFVLKDGKLEYFVDNNIVPKGSLMVDKMSMQVETLANESFLLKLNYLPESSSTRTYYLKFTTEGELFDWYFSILVAGYLSKVEKIRSQPCAERYAGFLYKVGSGKMDRWRKRWMTIENGHLLYYSDKDSAYPKGDVDVGKVGEGYEVRVGDVDHHISAPHSHTFRLVTPKRVYKFSAESQHELDTWVHNLNANMQKI